MAGLVTAGRPPAWPRLRDELQLYPGPAGRAGEPTWTLYDPHCQRFYRLGWFEVEILNRWNLGSPQAIASAVADETTLDSNPAAVETVKTFLLNNNLTVADSPEDVKRLVDKRFGKKVPLAMAVLKNYLFVRLPLVRPDAFLAATLGKVDWLFSRGAAVCFGILAIAAVYLVSRQWSVFTDSFASLLSFNGGILVLAALGVSKAIHELGHAYAAKSMGLRVPSMGVAFMCFAPVLWTDTSEAWKLPSKRQRLLIGASGVYCELIFAIAAALVWPLLPPGPMKTCAFLVAGSTWIMTLAININPCMRYDGYYLLSDYWDFPDLQRRAFALAKWRLREWLFGFGLSAPERLAAWDRFKLVVYALFTWVYRFFLFLGIALLVYALFFKALGLVLMLVELLFFIALPILREIGVWIAMRNHFTLNWRTARSAALFAFVLFFLAYPWHGRVDGVGLLYAERQSFLFAPMGARIQSVAAANGDSVEDGEVVLILRSPDLDHRIRIAEAKLASQRGKLSISSLDAELRVEVAAEWDELERLASELGGLAAQRDGLEIRAAFSGVVHDMSPGLREGAWVGEGEPLGVLTGGGDLVAAYVSETDWSRLRVGGRGTFYADGVGWAPLPVTISMIESRAVTELAYPELASLHGGPLPVVKDASGRLVPENAVYRVLCRVESDGSMGRFAVGAVSLEAAPRSLAYAMWINFVGLLVRESSW